MALRKESPPVTESLLTATTLRQIEESPTTFPVPSFVTSGDVDPPTIWRRIEAYCVWRSSPRAVEWIVEGRGSWEPPLTPATIESAQIWTPAVNGWSAVDFTVGPMGRVWLPTAGPYRIIATAGSDEATIPSDVIEAYKRLSEYWSGERGAYAGASHEVASVGPVRSEVHRSPEWMARAMINSGAADLLRPYRRAP
jgi:hypothetical protein